MKRHAMPQCGWAKTVRLAMGMSSKALGDRLGMSAQGVRQLEQSEVDGSISLRTLSRLANGLDCEVRYMLVPRTSLIEQVLQRAQEVTGIPLSESAKNSVWLQEAEALDSISALITRISRRGFW